MSVLHLLTLANILSQSILLASSFIYPTSLCNLHLSSNMFCSEHQVVFSSHSLCVFFCNFEWHVCVDQVFQAVPMFNVVRWTTPALVFLLCIILAFFFCVIQSLFISVQSPSIIVSLFQSPRRSSCLLNHPFRLSSLNLSDGWLSYSQHLISRNNIQLFFFFLLPLGPFRFLLGLILTDMVDQISLQRMFLTLCFGGLCCLPLC